MDSVKRKISFGIEAFDITPNIESAIEHSISDLGFKISSNPSYILELINYNGERIASFKYKGKDGGASEKDAKKVIMNKLVKDINSNLSSQLSNYLDGRFERIKY